MRADVADSAMLVHVAACSSRLSIAPRGTTFSPARGPCIPARRKLEVVFVT